MVNGRKKSMGGGKKDMCEKIKKKRVEGRRRVRGEDKAKREREREER